jgi:hypothetical protein
MDRPFESLAQRTANIEELLAGAIVVGLRFQHAALRSAEPKPMDSIHDAERP